MRSPSPISAVDTLPLVSSWSPAPEVMSADEVAAFLGVDRKTVYDAANRNQIPHCRLRRRILFSRAALVVWLRGTCKGSSESCNQ